MSTKYKDLCVCVCPRVSLCVWTGHFISREKKQITSLSPDQSSPSTSLPVRAHG